MTLLVTLADKIRMAELEVETLRARTLLVARTRSVAVGYQTYLKRHEAWQRAYDAEQLARQRLKRLQQKAGLR